MKKYFNQLRFNLTAQIRLIIILILKIYQKTLSFDHGPLKVFSPYGRCRFRPTCSDYTITAIERLGVVKGGLKAAWRILRCHPWSKGGWDPVK